MEKKKIIFLIIIFLLFGNIVFATNTFDVAGFIEEVKDYSSELFPEMADEAWLQNILNRRFGN